MKKDLKTIKQPLNFKTSTATIVAVAVAGIAIYSVYTSFASSTTVSCAGINKSHGAAEASVDIPHDGTYRIWSRIMAPDSENNSYYLGVGGDDCNVIGDTAIPANEWRWIDYKNNDSADKTDLSLSAGTQQVHMIGREPNVRLDKVIVSSDLECVPTGTGDNCASDSAGDDEESHDTTNPTVSLASPEGGATVTGTTTVAADASDDTEVSQVEFYVDGSIVNTDTTSPYEFGWGTAAVDDGSHTLKAVASDAAGNTASNSIDVTVNNADSEAPTAPTNLAITAATANQVDLAWDVATDNAGVDHYSVYRDESLIARTNEAGYSDTVVAKNTTYNYHVTAVDAAGNESAPSETVDVTTPQAEDTQAPSSPGDLSATAVNAGQVDLSWNDSTDETGVDGYYVYRDDAVVVTLDAGTTSHSDTGVLADTTYSYYVKAFDKAGNVSTASNTETVTTPTSQGSDNQAPSIPANLRASSPNKHQVNLNWDASTDNVAVSHYEVFRNGSLLLNTTTTSFGDGTVKPNKTYQYKIRAVDISDNKSDFSDSVGVTVKPTGKRKK